MSRVYDYVGPQEIRQRTAQNRSGHRVATHRDLDDWLRVSGQEADAGGLIRLTFIVDEEGILWVADRRFEHVACAGGRPVLAAGEIALRSHGGHWVVQETSNQSTGYCPEPDCWPALASALDAAAIPRPQGFSDEFSFRKCPACGERNIVKDGWFVCAICGADLPFQWNFA